MQLGEGPSLFARDGWRTSSSGFAALEVLVVPTLVRWKALVLKHTATFVPRPVVGILSLP